MGHVFGFKFLWCIVFNITLNCYASNVFDRNPVTTEENQGFIYNSIQNRSSLDNHTYTGPPRQPLVRKWQVGRVSRKHYEIINMLWRKTKIFMDVESTTDGKSIRNKNRTNTRHDKRHNKASSNSRADFLSSTLSFIEFYYLDSEDLPKMTDPPSNKTNSFVNDSKIVKSASIFKGIQRKPQQYPRITFHANDPNHRRSALTFNNNARNQNVVNNYRNFPIENLNTTRATAKLDDILKAFKLIDILGDKSLFGKKIKTVKIMLNGSTTTKMRLTKSNTKSFLTDSTTVYDKVKFFEIYDSHTFLYPTHQEKDDAFEMSIRAKDTMHQEKIDLESVDQNTGHSNSRNKSRHEKKHITYSSIKTTPQTRRISKEPTQTVKQNMTYEFRDKSALDMLIKETRYARIANMSRLAYWSSYPFVAVYIYEPTKTHCDAAGISPHWLIVAGACLSRHHQVHVVEARSAFVTYCGESWRQPERIAYVKYSVIHPKFHYRDKAKRHNYNIGLIQVSSSMVSSCTGWASISLMSHQFAASPEGSSVSALGWGLDRFGTKYMSTKLPHWPLTVYEGLVYSDSCPGSPAYSKAKRQDADNGANNVYCLLLPPYYGEEMDPVHGGLLLDGGKLIALYLQCEKDEYFIYQLGPYTQSDIKDELDQKSTLNPFYAEALIVASTLKPCHKFKEERRPSGLQSAQYTGIWRLIPWVLDVAREPENIDAFSLDM